MFDERSACRCPTLFGVVSSCSIPTLTYCCPRAISSQRGSCRSLFQQWPARVRSEPRVSRLLLFYGVATKRWFSPVDCFSSFPTTRLSVNSSLVSAGNSQPRDYIGSQITVTKLSHRTKVLTKCLKRNRSLFIYLHVGGGGGDWIAKSR